MDIETVCKNCLDVIDKEIKVQESNAINSMEYSKIAMYVSNARELQGLREELTRVILRWL